MEKIKIDIISDTVCPWCYVGIKNLEKGLEPLKSKYEFDIEWHPFQLNPGMSDEGLEYKDYLEKTLGNRTNEAKKAVQEKGTEAGINFQFDKIDSISNTLRSHYLVALAKIENKQTEVAKALYKAFFEEGKNINSIPELKQIGERSGLSSALLDNLDALQERDLLMLVQAEEGFRELGIASVPSFVIDSQFLVQGAQDPEVFTDVIQKIMNPEKESGCGCGSDGCC